MSYISHTTYGGRGRTLVPYLSRQGIQTLICTIILAGERGTLSQLNHFRSNGRARSNPSTPKWKVTKLQYDSPRQLTIPQRAASGRWELFVSLKLSISQSVKFATVSYYSKKLRGILKLNFTICSIIFVFTF